MSDRLFGPSLTTPAMAAAVSDEAWFSAMLGFERALAAVEARLGIIPEAAAAEIATACSAHHFDLGAIGRASVAVASPVAPLVDELRRFVGDQFARYVHHGATSQDVVDTAMMLVARDALDILLPDLSALAAQCAELGRRHRDDPMAGRTLLQQALPITFGVKCAGWLIGIVEARGYLRAYRKRRLAVQLGGPVGTLEVFGGRGLELLPALADALDLSSPGLPWHSNRVRVAELGAGLAMAAGAAAKIALDIVLLAQSEVGEVAELAPGRSSSIPHKRNPAHAIEARAAFTGVVAQAGLLLGTVPGEHERAAGSWQAEWPALSEAFRLSSGAVNRTREALAGLAVDTTRMRDNIAHAGGESVEAGAAQAIIDRALAIYSEEESIE